MLVGCLWRGGAWRGGAWRGWAGLCVPLQRSLLCLLCLPARNSAGVPCRAPPPPLACLCHPTRLLVGAVPPADAATAFHESLYKQKLSSLLEKKKLSEEDDASLREMQVRWRPPAGGSQPWGAAEHNTRSQLSLQCTFVLRCSFGVPSLTWRLCACERERAWAGLSLLG